jgi:hypothetical protein
MQIYRVKEVNVRLEVGKFARLKNLRTLRLRGQDNLLSLPSFSFSSDIMNLGDLCHLQELVSSVRLLHSESYLMGLKWN